MENKLSPQELEQITRELAADEAAKKEKQRRGRRGKLFFLGVALIFAAPGVGSLFGMFILYAFLLLISGIVCIIFSTECFDSLPFDI